MKKFKHRFGKSLELQGFPRLGYGAHRRHRHCFLPCLDHRIRTKLVFGVFNDAIADSSLSMLIALERGSSLVRVVPMSGHDVTLPL